MRDGAGRDKNFQKFLSIFLQENWHGRAVPPVP